MCACFLPRSSKIDMISVAGIFGNIVCMSCQSLSTSVCSLVMAMPMYLQIALSCAPLSDQKAFMAASSSRGRGAVSTIPKMRGVVDAA